MTQKADLEQQLRKMDAADRSDKAILEQEMLLRSIWQGFQSVVQSFNIYEDLLTMTTGRQSLAVRNKQVVQHGVGGRARVEGRRCQVAAHKHLPL
jgi:hypothetical protein